MMAACDLVVVGGGIVGLATAMELLARVPTLRLTVLEKEPVLAAHQTGHNSGVIHSGVYYRPDSLKARMCVAGAKLMAAFCRDHGIPHRICGKVIVATQESELPALDRLYQRGVANGVPGLSLLGPDALREIEPHARGLRAIRVPGTGIVDYVAVARTFAEVIRQRGGVIRTSVRVLKVIRRSDHWTLETSQGPVDARYLVSCAGLYADRLVPKERARKELRIIPFRGEYYDVIPSRCALIKGMIYPVPDPSMRKREFSLACCPS